MTAKYKKETLLKLYQDMVFYRRFEEHVSKEYQAGTFAGFLHLHIGQEAVCAGVQYCLNDDDYVISGYRSHTQAIAKGVTPFAVMSELFGKSTGVCKGKGGSMHMMSAEHNFLGGHGIVGGQTPLAAGVGFSIKYNKKDNICVCYLGDAATNQGQFFEALNMAATWDLPVLFVIENNQYGMGTDIRRTTSVDHLYKRALAFDMEHSQCDGMNVLNTIEHTQKIVKKMRKQPHAYLLEVKTYRYRGHSISDPAAYRSKEELEKYKQNDPILQLEKELLKHKLTTDALKAIDKKIKKEVKEIALEAKNAPDADLEQRNLDNYC